MKFHALALAAAATLAPTTLAGDEGPWVADYDLAVEQARREEKDLLIDFTGSDWCGWCVRLDNEVFSHEEFLTAATDEFVLVALDFPRGDEAKARVPNPERNQELSEKFAISGFPTIILATADGDAYAQTGYRPGGPEAYVEHLDEVGKSGKQALAKAIELAKAFETAEGEARREPLERILEFLDELGPDSPVAGRLEGPARTALELDPDNAAGLKLRASVALLRAGVADDAIVAAVKELDPENAAGGLELVALQQLQSVEDEASLEKFCGLLDTLLASEHPIRDKDLIIPFTVNGAFWASELLNDPVRAKRYAEVALQQDLSDDDELRARLEAIAGA